MRDEIPRHSLSDRVRRLLKRTKEFPDNDAVSLINAFSERHRNEEFVMARRESGDLKAVEGKKPLKLERFTSSIPLDQWVRTNQAGDTETKKLFKREVKSQLIDLTVGIIDISELKEDSNGRLSFSRKLTYLNGNSANLVDDVIFAPTTMAIRESDSVEFDFFSSNHVNTYIKAK